MSVFNSKRDLAVADEARDGYLACRTCRGLTLRETLVNRGGMCQPCYDAYFAEANPNWWPNRPLTHDERGAIIRKAQRGLASIGMQQDKRRWALTLKAREEGGEMLSRLQASAWRKALE